MKLKILLIFLASFGLCTGLNVNIDSSTKELNKNINSSESLVLVFTQSWPQTECYKWKNLSISNTCLQTMNGNWTIHGIWPTISNNKRIAYCNTSFPFDIAALDSIRNELLLIWPSNRNFTGSHDSFWQHEWDKHGTCALHIEELNSVLKYFTTGLDLMKKYDVTQILEKEKIFSGQSYSVQRIDDAIVKTLGKRCEITCFQKPGEYILYLHEVKIYMDETLKLIDYGDKFKTCPQHEKVTIPIS